MPQNYYPEPDEEQEQTEMPEEDGENMEEEGGQTALLPKSVLGGKKFDVGEEVVLKITHVYDDEVAVEYAPEKPEEGEGKSELAGDEEFDMAEEQGPGMGRGRMMRGKY